ncbi:MAG TPA: aminotransferase class I/II-fold pyridoxal phosphate-dependent enzyme [Terriglobales bacterium]|nr:aminotransferase class I/II-fold pyridoxal phosphate-dependent enzyme [Terriglobales bacterium]
MSETRKQCQRADATLCVHAGEERHGEKTGLTTAISQASVFVLPDVNEMRKYAEGTSDAYLYSRYGNPTVTVAEKKIAALEGGEACLVTSSGMAAILSFFLSVCRSGDEIVSMLDLYGGTTHLFQETLTRFGVTTHFVAFHELGNIEKFFTKKSRVLFLETPTNPTLRCADIAALAEIGHRYRCCVMVDNTFATPLLQKPLQLGADVVVHSATKYLGGHNDVVAGALAGAAEWVEPARQAMKQSGGCLDPMAAFLLIRGLKTLDIRVQRGCASAKAVAEFLVKHPRVSRVFYPGFSSNDGHQAAKRQMKDFGMMVAFEHRDGGAGAENFINRLRLWYLATSLGGVESTVSYPLLSSHIGLSEEQLKLADVSAGTVRLSVGIESPSDLLADLQQALG